LVIILLLKCGLVAIKNLSSWNDDKNMVNIFQLLRFFFNIFWLSRQDFGCHIMIRVWTDYNWKSWPLKWWSKFGWHILKIKIFFQFFFVYFDFFDGQDFFQFLLFSKLNLGHWIVIGVWTICNWESWPLKWWPKFSWHFFIIKIFFRFFFCSWDYIQVARLQLGCKLVMKKKSLPLK